MRPSLPLRVLASLAIVVVLAACGGSGGDDGADDTAATTGDPTTSTTAPDDGPPELTSRDAGLDLPRTLSYAGAEVVIEAARLSNATPATAARPEPTAGEDEILYLDVTTGFEEGFPGDDGFFPISRFAIVTEDGTDIVAQGLDMQAELPIAATTSTSATLAFEATEADLEGASLVYDDGEHVPAEVPLTDPVEESPYPIEVSVGSSQPASFKTGCEPGPAQVTLESVAWDVDAGVGADGAKLVRGGSSRALNGELYLMATFDVVAGPGACGGTYPNHEQFVATIDGRSIDAVSSYSLTLSSGQAAEMVFAFPVPEDSADVALVVGVEGATTATFPVELP